MPKDSARAMAGAAAAWLDSLDDAQRDVAHWGFPADDERLRWFYTPTDHGGLTLDAMTAPQRELAHGLLASGLSTAGYATAVTIMGLENVLRGMEGGRAAAVMRRTRDPDLYHFRVFGDPQGDGPWGWRVGGHHVSVHLTLVGGDVVAATPCFLGADPATTPLLGPHPLRPLAAAEDLARDLVRSLDDGQRAAALLSPVAPVDLVGGNRPRLADGDLPPGLPDVFRERFTGERLATFEAIQKASEEAVGLRPEHLEAVRFTPEPKGLAASDLSADQQEVLRALLAVYLDRVADDVAEAEHARFDGDRVGSLRFAWAGGTEPGEPHYYRVQGDDLVVEYDNVQRDANHVHSVWRSVTNDFGVDVLARHYAAEH